MYEEQRLEPRERLALPLRLHDGSHAMTRDISASGLYFEMDGEHDVEGLVDFEMQLPDLHMKFTAVGQIVRVEHKSGVTGVAVKLLSPRLEPIE
ncbi:MAG TPA: PilZ domain-containing protein [Ramlibacter sp.]|nr:PilZ domain-containing protein [Ramlibacter sp.]